MFFRNIWLTFSGLHDVISQKIVIFESTEVSELNGSKHSPFLIHSYVFMNSILILTALFPNINLI
jgi:hypothetical protein